MGRRTGVRGRIGEDGDGDGVCGSGESESGAFRREVVRDTSAEKGTDEASEISKGLAMSRWRRDGRGGAGEGIGKGAESGRSERSAEGR